MAAFDRKAYQRDLMRKRRAAAASPKLLETMKATWPKLTPGDQNAFMAFLAIRGEAVIEAPPQPPGYKRSPALEHYIAPAAREKPKIAAALGGRRVTPVGSLLKQRAKGKA